MSSVDAYKNYYKLLSSLGDEFAWYSSDTEPGKAIETEIKKRDAQYSELLASYVKITGIRNILKEVHKWIFFWVVIIACGFGLSLAYRAVRPIVNEGDPSLIVEGIPILITSIVAFISTVIAVPLTITNFLFNTKEDDNITDVIKHTQEHDAAGINLLKERFLKGSVQQSPSSDLHDD